MNETTDIDPCLRNDTCLTSRLWDGTNRIRENGDSGENANGWINRKATETDYSADDAIDHSGYDAIDHSGYDAIDHSGYDAIDYSSYDAIDYSSYDAIDHSAYDATDHSAYDAANGLRCYSRGG